MPRDDFPQRGMIFASGQWSAPNITLDSSESFKSMQQCVLTAGIDTLQFIPTLYYSNASNTSIYAKGDESVLRTTTDAELTNAMQFAASLHLNVALTVMLEPDYDEPSMYNTKRIYIGGTHKLLGENFTDAELQTWFTGYQEIVLRYASLAQQNNIAALILGHELNGIISHNSSAALFTALISKVRGVFSGQITMTIDGNMVMSYAQGNKIPWLKSLSFIGVSCYWPLGYNKTLVPDLPWVLPQVDDLASAYAEYVDELEKLSGMFGNMTVVCTDVGYQSRPYGWNHQLSAIQLDDTDCSVSEQCMDADAQALAYKAFLQAVFGRSWFGGAHWWLWRADSSAGGTSDDSYTPAGKPAVDVLREHSY